MYFLSPLQFLPSLLTMYPLWQLQILLCIVIEVLLYIVFSLTSAVSAVLLTMYPLWQLQILLCIVIEVLLYIVFSLTSAVSAVFADDVPTLAVTDIVMYCY